VSLPTHSRKEGAQVCEGVVCVVTNVLGLEPPPVLAGSVDVVPTCRLQCQCMHAGSIRQPSCSMLFLYSPAFAYPGSCLSDPLASVAISPYLLQLQVAALLMVGQGAQQELQASPRPPCASSLLRWRPRRWQQQRWQTSCSSCRRKRWVKPVGVTGSGVTPFRACTSPQCFSGCVHGLVAFPAHCCM
jgi:hypothetical protein